MPLWSDIAKGTPVLAKVSRWTVSGRWYCEERSSELSRLLVAPPQTRDASRAALVVVDRFHDEVLRSLDLCAVDEPDVPLAVKGHTVG